MMSRIPATRVRTVLFLSVIWSTAAFIRAEEASVAPLLLDSTLFPSELFPGLDQLNESELLLEALLRRFPDRILDRLPPEPTGLGGGPLVRKNDAGVFYVRVQDLTAALPAIAEALRQPVALIDLRYVHGDLDAAVALGSLLLRRGELDFELIGDYATASGLDETDRLRVGTDTPGSAQCLILALVNERTSGPMEAVLAELQAGRHLMTIGRPTSGQTASYRSIPGFPGWYAISGEIRPASAQSLVGTGLQPFIRVETDDEDERIAYDGFDPDRPLTALLEQAIEKDRFDEARLIRDFPHSSGFPTTPRMPPVTAGTGAGDDEASAPEPEPVDEALRRAWYVIEGMRAFGRIPED